jgi:tetratricopeptide (TPR) repeat protein
MADESRKILDDIFRHINAGQIGQAVKLCRSSLESDPENINVLGILGAILLQKGQLEDAENYLLKTIELEPAFAKPHEDLGVLYLRQDDSARAASFFQKATELDPRLATAFRGLRDANTRSGNRDQAEAAHRRFLELSPEARALAEAEKLQRNGETQEAERICEELIKREPGNRDALRMLAVIASDDERYIIAEGLLRRIAKLPGSSYKAHLELARFLAEHSRIPEAVELLQETVRLVPDKHDVRLMLGDMLAIVGRTTEALQEYERCLEQSPQEPTALLGRGHMLRIGGRRDDAVASYQECISERPNLGDAWWSLASVHGYRLNGEELDTMRSQVESSVLTPESEIAFRFAIARACEQMEDFEGAWEQYKLGNAAKRALIKYDPVETELQHDKLAEVFTNDIFERKSAATPADITPVFILGMPRSGSTLIEQILASHSMVEGADELPYVIMISNSLSANKNNATRYPEIVEELDDSQLTGLGRSYLHYALTHCANEKPFFTDKMPANFSHVGFIRLILPHAKIIDVRRDPIAACIANYRHLFAQGKNQSYDLVELAEYYLQYVGIMQHWDKVLRGDVLRVQYEHVVENLEGEVRRILEFCELPFEEACINYHESARPVNTASSEQVRQPIYDSAVNFWKNYEPHLELLRDILEPVL